MRHHSQRVPEKNFRLLGGKPLFHHILSTLSEVAEIDLICVDTDSDVIKEGVEEYFPRVKLIDRPSELRAPEVSMNRIIAHDLSLTPADFYLQTHSTNPLLKAETISRAIRTFYDQKAHFDSLFSVTRLQTRLYNSQGQALNHNPNELIQTQDLPPVFEENSCLYLFSEKVIRTCGHRIGKTPYLFEIPPEEAWDIDTPLDFKIVECFMSQNGE
jgi:CMP-N-acetylneuraminic acid synthetase